MTLDRAPRVAVVGVRRARTGLGQFFAQHLVAHGALVPAFIGTSEASIEEARALLAGQGIEARGFTRIEDLLDAGPVDALAIASPHETHAAWLDRALDHRLHALCEKPLVWGESDNAGRATQITREFHAHNLVLHENCPWPFTLPAFDALHPGVRKTGVRDFAMWLSPAQGGTGMLLDSISHPLSLLQALTGADEATVESVSFNTRELARGRLELTFRFVAEATRVAALVRLEVVPNQPRPAGFSVNGHPAERRVRMSDYALSFEERGRVVPVPDPMAALVGRFVESVRTGVPDAQARRERRRIAERMRMLEELVAAFGRATRS